MTPEIVQKIFLVSQLLLALVVVAFVLFYLLKGSSYQPQDHLFHVQKPTSPDAEPATQKPRPAPLKLSGFSPQGSPHEILGVSPQATPQEIQQAYRNLMKRFHPDLVGPPGSREWNDAQAIADAINRARDELLKKS